MKYKVVCREYIFEDDRPFDSCHAATLVLLPNDEVLAAWFGGTHEKAPDVAIWTSIRSANGWSAPVKTADDGYVAHWNPVLFDDGNGTIYLFYKVGENISGWRTMVKTSNDYGRTWSESRELVKGDIGGRGPVKNKPIILKDGTWVAPASVEFGFWDAFVDLSYDKGATWIKSQTVPFNHETDGKGIIQPTLWESEPGKVHMLLRSTNSCIYRSDSVDGGKTWCPAYPSGLPNNNSGIDLTKLDNGVLILCYNPVSGEKGPRTPLIISASYDNGLTWGDHLLIDEGEGQYSYPAIISKGNTIHIAYTWKRERIAYQKILVE